MSADGSFRSHVVHYQEPVFAQCVVCPGVGHLYDFDMEIPGMICPYCVGPCIDAERFLTAAGMANPPPALRERNP